MIRLNKYIASCGICSRRKAEEYITLGKISINGKIVTDLGTMIDEQKDEVELDGKRIDKETEKVYIMLNKPSGYITTNNEQFHRKCTNDLLHEKERVFPIGRLDKDTEGLLLFTNDGEFANQLMHPRNEIEKRYIAKVNLPVDQQMITRLENGVDIGGYVTRKARVKLLECDRLEITIKEGKNRQIRKMCAAVGLKVISLQRIQLHHLTLGNLKVGEYRYLTQEETKGFF